MSPGAFAAEPKQSGWRFAALALTTILTSCGESGGGSTPPSTGIVGIFTGYAIPQSPTELTEPDYIVSGSDGALWFTEFGGNNIGRITTAGAITEFPIPSVASSPEGITSGPDGALWFAERDASKIGRITTGGVITEYAVPAAASNPVAIATGPDGALWFIGSGANTIGRISTRGVFKTFTIPNQAIAALDITAGPDGALWFTEYPTGRNGGIPNQSSAIGRITTNGTVTAYPLPTADSSPGSITVGSDKALWFADLGGIGRITTSGAISQYPLNVPLLNIALGPDGAIWGTEIGNGQSAIARISLSGAITTYNTPTALFDPGGITAGPDGAVWFTAYTDSAIGRLH